MILFNLLNLLPHMALGRPLTVLAPVLEITGGLKLLGDALPLSPECRGAFRSRYTVQRSRRPYNRGIPYMPNR